MVNAAKEKLPHRIFLFYSNRRPEDAAFLEELQTLEIQNPNYKLIATMTEMEKSTRPWKGEVGLIDYGDAGSAPEGSGVPDMVHGRTDILHCRTAADGPGSSSDAYELGRG